jgi:hypothetical protein
VNVVVALCSIRVYDFIGLVASVVGADGTKELTMVMNTSSSLLLLFSM